MNTDRDWRHRAACRSVDPERFFPSADSGPLAEQQESAAKRICAPCPVRDACLDFALRALPHGIAGGLTADERRALRAAERTPYLDSAGRLIGAGRDETAAVGRSQVAAGRRPRVVQHEFGVSIRTVQRWAAQARTEARRAEGSRGGNRAPLQNSHTSTQAGTRAEGPESR